MKTIKEVSKYEYRNKYQKEWRKNNPEKAKKQRDKYRNAHKENHKQWIKENKEDIRAYQKKYFAAHPEKTKSYFLKNKYNISIEMYNEIFNNQKGCCAICGKHQSEFKKALAVDHDHKTGKVRGLLCCGCNRALGDIKEDINSLSNAILYLEKYKERR